MNPQPSTVDGRTLAIGVLSVTACTLLVGFLLVTTLSRPVQAIGTADRGGDYKMVTQQLTTSSEGLVVVDGAAKRLILYGFDYGRRQLVPLDVFALGDLRKPAPENVRPAGGRP